MATHQTCVTIGEVEDIPVTIHYEYVRACIGSTDGRFGQKIEPDEPAHVEIDRVVGPEGREFELTFDQESRIEREIMDDLSDGDSDAYDDRDDDWDDDRSNDWRMP